MASGVKSSVKIDFTGLDDLKKQIGKRFYTKVGLLGNTAGRKNGEAMDNPSLGVTQELGTLDGKIPPRSWLRFPLEYKMKDIVEFLQSKPMRAEIARGNIKQFMKLWGTKAEKVIKSAFESGGFGTWAANKPSTIAAKGSSAPLIDTSQMRRAVDSKVVEK